MPSMHVSSQVGPDCKPCLNTVGSLTPGSLAPRLVAEPSEFNLDGPKDLGTKSLLGHGSNGCARWSVLFVLQCFCLTANRVATSICRRLGNPVLATCMSASHSWGPKQGWTRWLHDPCPLHHRHYFWQGWSAVTQPSMPNAHWHGRGGSRRPETAPSALPVPVKWRRESLAWSCHP